MPGLQKTAGLVYGNWSSKINMDNHQVKTNKIVEETHKIEIEAKKQLLTYLVSAFGLIAGLAWNETIKSIIELIFPIGKDTILAKFFYAIIVTLFVVILTVLFTKLLKDKKEE